MAKRTNKGRIRSLGGLARNASPRQRRLYGRNGARVPKHDQWQLEVDAKYARDLAKHPEARLWLSVFNEERLNCTYLAGEPHIHTIEQLREYDRERKARAANEDVMSFGSHRGPSLDAVPGLADRAEAGDEEDRRIAELDRRRALRLRKGGKS